MTATRHCRHHVMKNSHLKNWKLEFEHISHNGYVRNSEHNGRIKNGGYYIGFFVAMVTLSEK